MAKIFISYRRKSWAFTHRLADDLRARLDADIFVDIDSIDQTNFEQAIVNHLRKSDVVLLVISDTTFSDRIHRSDDWVRREIREALERKIPLILVRVEGLLPPSDLPDDIKAVTGMQGINFYPDFFPEGVQKLADFIIKVKPSIQSRINLPTSVTPAAKSLSQKWSMRQVVLLTIIGILIILAFGLLLYQRLPEAPIPTPTTAAAGTQNEMQTPDDNVSTPTVAVTFAQNDTQTQTRLIPTETLSVVSDLSTTNSMMIEGVSLRVVGGRNYLYIILPGEGNPEINGLTFEMSGIESQLFSLIDYANFQTVIEQNRPTRPVCLVIATGEYFADFIYPTPCNRQNTIVHNIDSSNIFWYEPGTGYRPLYIANANPELCSANISNGYNCDMIYRQPVLISIIITTSAPSPTRIPTETMTLTAMATSTSVPINAPTITQIFIPTESFTNTPIFTIIPEVANINLIIRHNEDWYPSKVEVDSNGVQMVEVPPGCLMITICFDYFYIDKYEVSNGQFEKFGGYADSSGTWIDELKPREQISGPEAKIFCEKRGGRLPTQLEWEYAGRGPDELIYPWGNNFDIQKAVHSTNEPAFVGSKPTDESWVGAMDMSGNVSEWVYSEVSDYIIMAGAWSTQNDIEEILKLDRNFKFTNIQHRSHSIGFRCVKSYWRD